VIAIAARGFSFSAKKYAGVFMSALPIERSKKFFGGSFKAVYLLQNVDGHLRFLTG